MIPMVRSLTAKVSTAQEFFQATPGAPNNGTATPPASFIAYSGGGFGLYAKL